MATVAEIVVERLIKKIEENKKLPWQVPYILPCINWFTDYEYKGINRILLNGGEYISVNQLKKYNEKNNTNFWFKTGTEWDIAVYYNKKEEALKGADLAHMVGGGSALGLRGVITKKAGVWYRLSFTLVYHRVYDIKHMSDDTGAKLVSKFGNTVIVENIPADEIINGYCTEMGVKVLDDGKDGCYHSNPDRGGDGNVHMVSKELFKGMEEYYRVVFHELIHSTGVKNRLNRKCLTEYVTNAGRSREELIAEFGSVLLASEAGFSSDNTGVDNSEVYMSGWIGWMKDNVNEVISGMQSAEKAKNYVLSRGKVIEDLEATAQGVIS